MRRLVLLLLLWPALVFAAPDRAGLIAAWEAAMRSDGTLEVSPDGGYRYRNESIGYDGAVKIVNAIVRTPRIDGAGKPESETMGTVDFDLADLPGAHGDNPSMGLSMWMAERQSFIYDAGAQTWQTSMDWARSRYRGGDHSDRTGSWLMQYAVPIGLLLLVATVFWWLLRVQKQAKKQLAGSAQINQLARENIERATQLQDEQRARMDETLALARRNTATLEAILEELRRRPLA